MGSSPESDLLQGHRRRWAKFSGQGGCDRSARGSHQFSVNAIVIDRHLAQFPQLQHGWCRNRQPTVGSTNGSATCG